MKLGQRIVDGVFQERPNRYLAQVVVDGNTVPAHVPDPGRLPGLMIPGRRVRLLYNPGPQRKTDYSLVLVRHGRIWVSVYPVFANALVRDALGAGSLEVLTGYDRFDAEVKHGKSRFDFRLRFGGQDCYVEVKSVSCVEKTVGKFPDAPTERGRRHIEELIELKKKGNRAAVLFVSQRSDTRTITSYDDIDPAFGEILRQARDAGVELYGYNCRVTASSVSLNRPLNVVL
ncbi:DNA/RNA nuclease SfsA [Nitrospina gracilis]|uniref:DNA/RNA nuclease SfsA n=1 Tax=Nitrospina gracilis TaxID=35801 RepID=UPI001F01612F|nr:DNA/RNA nuclease SfsA [Nitrospina gracilis]MCF8720150.1 sugar fermentation stimulation protein A [Nitrospina gracilis Nb-211]